GSSGDKGGSGFRLVQFLLAGQDNVARNATVTFVFSSPVQAGQNLAERLKIQNIDTSGPVPNFSLAGGDPRVGESAPAAGDGQGYLVSGARVDFMVRLPSQTDTSDAGFRANGEYHVFLKAGPDGLRSAAGDLIARAQEFIFETGDFFEDPFSGDPPRALGLTAVDVSGANADVDLSRLDPAAGGVAAIGNETLRTHGLVIDPAGGGLAPAGSGREDYDTPWELRLRLSEPVDPGSVTAANVSLTQIEEDSLTANNVAGQPGQPVSGVASGQAPEPLELEIRQNHLATGFEVFLVVRPLNTLTDDARYRLEFSGHILGIDSRNTLFGTNGLTGDGQTGSFEQETFAAGGTSYLLTQGIPTSASTVRVFVDGVETTAFGYAASPQPTVTLTPPPGAAQVTVSYQEGLAVTEVGGLGYRTEFLVRDVGAIARQKVLEFDPLVDRVQPELQDLTRLNTALYNPSTDPSMAVGFLNAFGTGKDGHYSVPTSGTATLDTGDTPNDPLGKPFVVQDLNPGDDFLGDPLPGGPLTYDSVEPTEFEFKSFTVGNNAVLTVTGVNPIRIRVQGLVQITGTVDLSGGDGRQTGAKASNVGGAGGPGGFEGGSTSRGIGQSLSGFNCASFSTFVNRSSAAKNGFPFSRPGKGPGRGMPGGEVYAMYYHQHNAAPPTGGGGASHGTQGQAGEDLRNANGTPGTPGSACSTSSSTGVSSGTFSIKNSGVIGVRGEPGPTYGDRAVIDVLIGGSGGGAGGTEHNYYNSTFGGHGGASGGGGGGTIEIFASDTIKVAGAIDASGGDGGRAVVVYFHNGGVTNLSPTNPFGGGLQSWKHPLGGAGGGSGGNIVLVSARDIELAGTSELDASGGDGGKFGTGPGQQISCNGCNEGGAGGNGFIFLMDPDGTITGLNPGVIGVQNGKTVEYDTFPPGVLTTSSFDGARFQATNLYTELFSVGAADPQFKALDPAGVTATAATGQKMRMLISSAVADPLDPLVPDKTTEAGDPADPFNAQEIKVALIDNDGVSVRVLVAGDAALDPAEEVRSLANLNNVAGRRAFIRVHV
ncbi:MAG: hypothetical protein ACE5JH_12680, partial [Acidobacteriota bacterium]